MSAEFDLIRSLQRAARPDSRTPLGIGDDAAVLNLAGRPVVCCDLIAEGTHFPAETPPDLVGRKALAVNLSDCAAMAATPTAAFVGLLVDRRRGFAYAEAIMGGLTELAEQFDVTLAGGDTATHDGPTSVCVTVVGTCEREVRRTGARPGDALLVTGSLGGSLPSGRHLTFPPRVAEAQALVAAANLHAMIDLSDGLLADCGRLCEASGVSAELTAEAIPVAEGAAGLRAALTDGEDFELLFAVAETDAVRLLADPPVDCGLTRVGRIGAGAGVTVRDATGEPLSFRTAGYEHQFAS
ncbi:thiamine-phosphate kinase [Alienimonas chondri]|uniref:Thiamine-monophosphate kinase n=1 Tax=Alienimonas chondri TaxID=2681879 RepID=A0ABX1V850_9PLAN|nr:thiamine-phosphate kinase [Alienimonas chondri]NNJ24004.1 Thiamine-monophosphate kinase [Alienimonas chondri]